MIVFHNFLFTLMGAGEDFSRPAGTPDEPRGPNPTVKTVGHYRPSLRDNQDEQDYGKDYNLVADEKGRVKADNPHGIRRLEGHLRAIRANA